MALAGHTPGTEGANMLRDTWDSEIATNPTEEGKVAAVVERPIGAEKFGNNLYLRKVLTMTANTLGATSLGDKSALTYNQQTDERVSLAAKAVYSAFAIAPHTLTRLLDDAQYRAAKRKQCMAAITETIDSDLFALAASASLTESGTDIDGAMVRSAFGKLAKNAKGKYRHGQTKVFVFIHPDEIKNAMAVPEFQQYQIRGTLGSAANGKIEAYGTDVEESGLVYTSAGVAYQPFMLKDAWVLAFNQSPTMLEPERDGLAWAFHAWTEYGVQEWFDSSIVSLNTSV